MESASNERMIAYIGNAAGALLMRASNSIILSIVVGQGFDGRKSGSAVLLGYIYTVTEPDRTGWNYVASLLILATVRRSEWT